MKKIRIPKWAAITLSVVAAWLLCFAIFGGKASEERMERKVEWLVRDSIALEEDHTPSGYTKLAPQDVVKIVGEIRDLGRFDRFGVDSTDLAENPRLASLAEHNVQRCEQVLGDVLPGWRRTYALTLNKWLPEGTIARIEDGDETLAIYSLQFLNPEKEEETKDKYLRAARKLGFSTFRIGISPDGSLTEYYLQ